MNTVTASLLAKGISPVYTQVFCFFPNRIDDGVLQLSQGSDAWLSSLYLES